MPEPDEPGGEERSPEAAPPAAPDAAPGAVATTPEPPFVRWALVNVLSAALFAALLTGLPGFVLAVTARSAWRRGDADRARRRLKAAATLGALSIVWGALVTLAAVVAAFVVSLGGTGRPLAPPSY
jgi:hypothetical protein